MRQKIYFRVLIFMSIMLISLDFYHNSAVTAMGLVPSCIAGSSVTGMLLAHIFEYLIMILNRD